jgi:DNA repair protein RAD5
VTTYGTLQGELNSKAGSAVLLGCHWLRVILDEAHCVRNQRTLASRACCALKADHRWCVSGTIIQNSMDDLLGVMKFLQHEPWCWNSFWKAAISDPANETDPEKREESLRVALDRARRVLNPIMLRRNKDSLSADGTPILTLPPIETKIVKVELSEPEREFYQAVLHQSQTVFAGFEKNGTASKSYFQIFSLLQRLRQTCDHISLTVKSRVDSTDADDDRDDSKKERGTKPASESSDEGLGTQFFENLLAKFAVQEGSGRKKRCPEDRNGNQEPELDSPSKRKAYASSVALSLSQAIEDNATHVKDECAICLETPKIEDAVLTPCAHVFCRECLLGVLHLKGDHKADAEGSCPTCQLSVKPKQVIAMKKRGNNMAAEFLTDTKLAAKTSKSTMERKENARDILLQSIGSVESAKMKAIFTELALIWEADPRAKILIFSHYLGFLDLLRIQLQRQQLTHFRLDGSLRLKEGSSVLAEFRCCPERSVLLMSMSAGGEGLNIVSASACFIVEPWWNSAKEDQCVNRIHRIGQLADTVLVRKFVVADTVEESMVELQKRKAYVADEVYSASGTVDSEASARLSLDDFRLIFRGNQGLTG